MEVVVLVELEAVDEGKRGLDLARFGDRCGAVQLRDRRSGEPGELAVQGGKLRPVLRLVDVQRGDRRLQHVGTAAAECQRALDRCSSRRDLLEIPERSILVAKEDDRFLGESRLASGVVDQHQRQQSHLKLDYAIGKGYTAMGRAYKYSADTKILRLGASTKVKGLRLGGLECRRDGPATYAWSRFDNNYMLRLKAVEDPCAIRREVLEGDWHFLD
jgi:hypothetical protein